MSDGPCEAKTKEKNNTAKEEFLCYDIDGERFKDYSQNILQDESLLNARLSNIAESQNSDKWDTEKVSIDDVEDQPKQIKEVEGLIKDKDKHNRKTFDETVGQFELAFQSPIKVSIEDNPKLIPKDKTDKRKSIGVDDNFNNATQDIIVDEIVLCCEDKNENNKDLLSDVTDISESSDEECTKKSKLFTFTDSDLPDSDEITENLMSYPKPKYKECFSEIEQVDDNFEEIYRFLRRSRKKPSIDRIGDLTNPEIIEKLPQRVITRKRKVPERYGKNANKYLNFLLQSRYIKVVEDQIDPEIIMENIKRLKRFAMEDKHLSMSRKNVNSHEDNNKKKVGNDDTDRKVGKSKYKFGRKVSTKKQVQTNVKSRLRSTLIDKTTARTIKSMKTENESKNTVNKLKNPKNKIKPDYKQTSVKVRNKPLTLHKIESRRSKRQKESSSRNKTDNSKSKDPQVRIKVNVEKLKKKNAKQKSKYSVRNKMESQKNTNKDDSLDSTLASKITTRSKKKETECQNNANKLISPENVIKDPSDIRKRTNKLRQNESIVSPNIIVSRKKRQTIVKKKNNESTVHNISSSSSESPKSLKRSMVDDSDMPSTKRTRSHNASSNSGINNASLRATPARVRSRELVLLPSKQNQDPRGPFVRLVRLQSSYSDGLSRRAERGNTWLKRTRTFTETRRTTRPCRARH